jgi:hypothetical protein
MVSFRLCIVFFFFVATLMLLPPALHAGVTAAIILLVLIAPIAHRWAESRQVVDFEHRHPRSSCDLSE